MGKSRSSLSILLADHNEDDFYRSNGESHDLKIQVLKTEKMIGETV